VILQLDRAGASDPDAASIDDIVSHDVLATRALRRFAAALVGRSGRLAASIVVPWAAAAPPGIRAIAVPGTPAALLADALRLADRLGSLVATSAGMSIAAILEGLEGLDPETAGRLSTVTIPRSDAGRVLGAIRAVGDDLAANGVLESADQVWWQTPDWLAEALTSDAPRPAARWLGDRWADLVYAVAACNGSRASGIAASSGRAAGRATYLRTPNDAAHAFRARDVLFVDQPLQAYAPLLWSAAALVSRSGSPGAHLCEVARSLRLPAVVSAEIAPPGRDAVAAVDGRTGAIRLWTEGGAGSHRSR
jgi:hypothetical protein